MKLDGQLAIGLLDLLVARALADAEGFVIVAFCHGQLRLKIFDLNAAPFKRRRPAFSPQSPSPGGANDPSIYSLCEVAGGRSLPLPQRIPFRKWPRESSGRTVCRRRQFPPARFRSGHFLAAAGSSQRRTGVSRSLPLSRPGRRRVPSQNCRAPAVISGLANSWRT